MKVTLISHTKNPLEAICLAVLIMKEKYPRLALGNMKPVEQRIMVREILKTRLRGPLEFASFEFFLDEVSRTFTHQLVRHRTFHFSQQSMRFFDARESKFINPVSLKDTEGLQLEREGIRSIRSYQDLISMGATTEDARSILPQNIATKIMFGCTYRSLVDLAEVRVCHQAQGEFREVMESIIREVGKISLFLANQLVAVCSRTGRCEFKSIYDRSCPIEKTLKGEITDGNN